MFREAKRILQGHEEAERAFERSLGRRCDWDDPSDVAEYRSGKSLAERLALLDRLVPDRKCPGCGKIRLQSRQWVLNKRQTRAACRSCVQRSQAGTEPVDLAFSVFIEEPRFKIDGLMLVQAREAVSLSKREFARRAGWARQYQDKLEGDGTLTVSYETAAAILKVLREAGAFTEDCL